MSVEQFGVLRGRLAQGEARDRVLAEAELTPQAWEEEVITWAALLAEDLERGEEERVRRYVRAVQSVSAPEVSSQTEQVDMRAVRAAIARDATPFGDKPKAETRGDDDTEKHDMRLLREALASPAPSGTEQVDMRAVREAIARGATPFEAGKLAMRRTVLLQSDAPPPEPAAPATRRRGR